MREGSGVGRRGGGCVHGEPHVEASTGSEAACKGARIQEGALSTLPARKGLLLKGPDCVFLIYLNGLFTSALSVISAPRSRTSPGWHGATHFQIVAYFHTVGTIVATLECLLSELD